MLSPREEYLFNRRVDGIEDIAHYTLFEKYIIEDLRGQEKKQEITSTDQESLLIKKAGGYPFPGFTYTFMYKGKNIKYKNGQPFTDLVPIVFCINSGSAEYFTGINMNLLPKEARLKFLQSFYETFKGFLKREIDVLAQNNQLALNIKFIDLIKSGEGQKMIKIFNSKTNENFNLAYRKYLFRNIRNFRMIEYSELRYLPFYVPKNAFRRLNHSQIHELYQKLK